MISESIKAYSNQENYNRESEGKGFGIITVILGDLIVMCSGNLSVGLSSMDQKIHNFYSLSNMSLFVINLSLT